MPIYLEPDHTFETALEGDKDKSPKPVFVCRTQSMRGQRAIAAVLDRMEEEGTTISELFDATIAELERVVVRTVNMPGFQWNLLSYSEARELLRKVMYNQRLEHEEKKD